MELFPAITVPDTQPTTCVITGITFTFDVSISKENDYGIPCQQ